MKWPKACGDICHAYGVRFDWVIGYKYVTPTAFALFFGARLKACHADGVRFILWCSAMNMSHLRRSLYSLVLRYKHVTPTAFALFFGVRL